TFLCPPAPPEKRASPGPVIINTRAELVSIQPLSAELLASATCCSSLAMRALVSEVVEGVCASNGWEKEKRESSRKNRWNLEIRRFPMKSWFTPAGKVDPNYSTRFTLPPAAPSRKLKLFIVPI